MDKLKLTALSSPDLINLLELDATANKHQNVVIAGPDLNNADFAISALLQHFCRRNPIPVCLLTLFKNWDNYTACAAKNGTNLRRTSNGGNVEIIDLMSQYLNNNICDKDTPVSKEDIFGSIKKFIEIHSHSANDQKKVTEVGQSKNNFSIVIMIDDLSCLEYLGLSHAEILEMFEEISALLTSHCNEKKDFSSLVVIQSHYNQDAHELYDDMDTNTLIRLLAHSSDIFLEISPLPTGYSRQTDGFIKINDYRTKYNEDDMHDDNTISPLAAKVFHFKLSDRRTKLELYR